MFANITLQEYQHQLLELLLSFDQFCSMNGIKYTLEGGSLIGAIRHHGFIPWDDDLDVSMDRENYSKLLEAVNKGNDFYFIHSNSWVRRFSKKTDKKKLIIDVFPFDNMPDNKLIASMKALLIRILQGMIENKKNKKKYSFGYRILVFITHIMGMPFSLKTKQSMFDKISLIGNNKKTKYKACYSYPFRDITCKYDANTFESFIRTKFENIEVSVIQDYDHFLKIRYGDYMKLPPIEKRIPLHRFKNI